MSLAEIEKRHCLQNVFLHSPYSQVFRLTTVVTLILQATERDSTSSVQYFFHFFHSYYSTFCRLHTPFASSRHTVVSTMTQFPYLSLNRQFAADKKLTFSNEPENSLEQCPVSDDVMSNCTPLMPDLSCTLRFGIWQLADFLNLLNVCL